MFSFLNRRVEPLSPQPKSGHRPWYHLGSGYLLAIAYFVMMIAFAAQHVTMADGNYFPVLATAFCLMILADLLGLAIFLRYEGNMMTVLLAACLLLPSLYIVADSVCRIILPLLPS